MLGDQSERDTAVFGNLRETAALRSDDCDGEVDERHEKTTENSRKRGAFRDRRGFFYSEVPDYLNNHDSEREACERVHSVVSVEETLYKGSGCVVADGRDVRNVCRRRNDRHDHKHAEENEERRVKDFSDPGENLSGEQRERQNGDKERRREQKKENPREVAERQRLLESDRKRRRRASGDREERSDREVQRDREEFSERLADFGRHIQKSVTAAHTERSHAEERKAYAGYEEAECGYPYVAARVLPQLNGENKVPRAEKHTEQHARYAHVIARAKFLFRFQHFSFSLPLRTGLRPTRSDNG